jgi:hypothetical protein
LPIPTKLGSARYPSRLFRQSLSYQKLCSLVNAKNKNIINAKGMPGGVPFLFQKKGNPMTKTDEKQPAINVEYRFSHAKPLNEIMFAVAGAKFKEITNSLANSRGACGIMPIDAPDCMTA